MKWNSCPRTWEYRFVVGFNQIFDEPDGVVIVRNEKRIKRPTRKCPYRFRGECKCPTSVKFELLLRDDPDGFGEPIRCVLEE